jgi:hypothetical protein
MKSDLMATIVPGTLLLALAAFGGCVIPAASSGGGGYPANNGGGYPASSGGGYSSAAAPAPGESGPPPSSTAASAPAGPQVVSVTLHNDCPNTVKLFLGDKPKFGSGTNTSLGSNTTTSYQMKAGDMIWITDDSENGVSSTSIGGGSSQSIRIMPSCTGFGPY